MSAIVELKKLVGEPSTFVEDDKAPIVKAVLAQYVRLGEEEKRIAAERAEIRQILIDFYEPDTSDLVVDGVVLATYKAEPRTYIDTDQVRELFPQVEYPSLYNETVTFSLRVTKNGKNA